MENSAARSATPPPFPVTAPWPLRVLYADDLAELRDVARLSLEREGHQVECVEDGAQAWEKISENPSAYDVVITDHHMPTMNGVELVARLRALPYAGKIVIFSSELSPAVMRLYQQHRVDRIVYKPIYPSRLRQVLRELAGMPATER